MSQRSRRTRRTRSTAYQNVSDLINARWHATYGMVRAIERGVGGDEWKAARDEYAAADKDWAIRYTSVARDIAFYVDTPFGFETKDKLSLVWPLPCTKFALGEAGGAGLDASTARVVLEIINHCTGLVSAEIDKTVDAAAGAPPKLDAATRKAFADSAYPKLDAIYKTNEALRCVIFARSLAIRESLVANSYWGSFFGFAQPTYAPPGDGKECSADGGELGRRGATSRAAQAPSSYRFSRAWRAVAHRRGGE